MRTATLAIVSLAISSLPVCAQGQGAARGATIAGTVRDSAARPIVNADIIVRPGYHRARSDSAGGFLVTGLDGGGYVVVARKIGYAADQWDIKLSSAGRVDLAFVLARRAELDTVVVSAARNCPASSFDGFECRRRVGGGLFLDYPEIDDMRQIYTADLFRVIPGFRVRLRSTRAGVVPTPVANGFGCISEIVDGRPASAANPPPSHTRDLMAMEVYAKPDSVPPDYRRFTWPSSNAARTGRSSVVVYWTIRAPTGSPPDGNREISRKGTVE